MKSNLKIKLQRKHKPSQFGFGLEKFLSINQNHSLIMLASDFNYFLKIFILKIKFLLFFL
jgi:hypothetical protein